MQQLSIGGGPTGKFARHHMGDFLMYQAKKQKQLGNARSNLATFFSKVGVNPALAHGL